LLYNDFHYTAGYQLKS